MHSYGDRSRLLDLGRNKCPVLSARGIDTRPGPRHRLEQRQCRGGIPCFPGAGPTMSAERRHQRRSGRRRAADLCEVWIPGAPACSECDPLRPQSGPRPFRPPKGAAAALSAYPPRANPFYPPAHSDAPTLDRKGSPPVHRPLVRPRGLRAAPRTSWSHPSARRPSGPSGACRTPRESPPVGLDSLAQGCGTPAPRRRPRAAR